MCERSQIVEKRDIPADAKYLYIGSVNAPDHIFYQHFLFDVDERRPHQRLLRMAKHANSFNFLKISTQYAHSSDYEFYAVYYRGDYISPENQAVIDALNAFPKDDPLAFYDECMKHILGESYNVDRDGNRTGSMWTTSHLLGKGIVDFTTPETYHKMTQLKVNTYEWERFTSQMEQDDNFRNIYEKNEVDS